METDLFLGGRWLPVGEIAQPQIEEKSIMSTAQKSGKDAKSAAERTKIVEEKRQRLNKVAGLVAKCSQCSLHKGRRNVVPGEGDPDARIVFIGEAPGGTEDQKGRPFVGRAGKLLDKIISAMGLTREEVFIGNILKCRPPGNRDPQATEITACMDYLYQQLDIIEPEIIVALGAHAARTLLNTNTAIGQLRGKIHEYLANPFAQPIKLVATYHPAYLLRNYSPDNRLRVWQDMQRVLEELGLPVPKK